MAGLIILLCLVFFGVLVFRAIHGLSLDPQNSIMRTFGPWVIGNFLLCAAIHITAGGDALGGYVENGIYFLESKGRLIETSAWFWNFSAVYMRVTMLSVAVMFLLGVIQQMFFLRL